MKKLLIPLLLILAALPCKAQRHRILNSQIRSLQVVANNDWLSMPVMELHHGRIDIDFDDMTHEYHRYLYKIQQCEADWSVSEELFESDFCQGFASGNAIEDVKESLLTNTLYTHYSFSLPNEKCSIKMSGNYMVTVYDDNNEEEPILTACFMVVEPRMGVSLQVTTNTDVDVNDSHQQVAMSLNYGGINVSNPQEQIKTVLLQNGRWDQARKNVRPQYIMPDGLRWDHTREYIFDAGNEYRKFEILSTDVASMGIERISWEDEDFHAYPFISLPRANYIYDESANGAFYLRNSDNIDSYFTSDYMQVHFLLKTPQPLESDIYINANWTNDRFLPEYRMTYQEEGGYYEAVIPLKLGYYSYQFLTPDQQGNMRTLPSEGNFFQTKNQYQAFVYYKEPGGRTDQLVGYCDVSMR